MVLEPDRSVFLDVDQVPGGERQAVQVFEIGPAGIHLDLSVAGEREALDVLERRRRIAEEDIEEVTKGFFAFADQDVVGAGRQIRLGVVGGIGAGDDYRAAAAMRRRGQNERCGDRARLPA